MNVKNYKPDFAILDGIRGIAATYVVINHCRGHMLIGGSELAKIKPVENWSLLERFYYMILQLTSIGTEFVIVFFVLSGFSIAYSLRNGQNVREFLLKRFIRLYPPYLISLVWAYVVFIIIQKFVPELNIGDYSVFKDLKIFFGNLIYINNGGLIPQFWSLKHEVIFYIMIIFALLKRKIYYIVSLIAYILGLFLPNDFISSSIITMFTFKYHIYFVIGVYLYFNYTSLKTYLEIKKTKLFYLAIISLFIVCVLANFLTKNDNITFLIAAIGSVLMVVNFLEKNITNRFIKWAGEMSYTLYITHFASIYIFYALLVKLGVVSGIGKIQIWWLWPFAFIVSFFFSYIFYFAVERNTKFILDKIRKKEL